MTVRGKQAETLLHNALKVKEHELKKKNFSQDGKYHIIFIEPPPFSNCKALLSMLTVRPQKA